MDLNSTLTAVLCTLAVLCSCAVAQDDQREVPIIKQINRVNDDGTYTFGYEAADGSFKIETRDVLGNVKGMFGYIDDRGELKRVSYTANNGTGFQATGNIGRDSATRRPVLIYRGLGRGTPSSRREEDQDGSTTPVYGEYLTGRRGGYAVTTTTEEPTTTRPLRILVTKRPLETQTTRNPNLIRRQLERDRDDYSSRRFRYQQPATQDPREVYRNQLLEQNNLKPEYSSSPRVRYYTPVEEDYPDIPGGGRTAASPSALERSVPQRYAPPIPPPIPNRYNRPYEDPYLLPDRRYPPATPFRRPPLYDGYDYETFREAMNYLIQYLQYMRRTDPYMSPYGPYTGDIGGGYFQPRPRLPIGGIPPAPYPGRGVPPPPVPPVPAPSPYGPYGPVGLGGYQGPGPIGLGGYQGPGPIGFGGYQAPNLPYINPNVQYSSPETAQTTAQEQLSNLKSRMDHSDHTDSADHRPPTSSLIRMLLARPSTQRPAIRSVEILGTAATSSSTQSTTTTTTEQQDLMEASS